MSPHEDMSIDVSQIAPLEVELELEPARAHNVVGPYGAFVATMAPAEMVPQPWRMQHQPQSQWRSPAPRTLSPSVERVMESLAVLPMGVWKRVALYSFLFMLFGNLLRCRGLASSTNFGCVLLLVLGLAGMVAVSVQRNP